ncbi:DUF3307 domain-containing protein [Brevibacillus reuszeri]|uniref:DUF3307 domain-containing protein n=1 Tax=Brevibacillus reuszeri TaxID=54915 RepID=UPI00366B6421
MDFTVFCTAFILQFVGHRVGDYLFQTDWQAQNKSKDVTARLQHVMVYSLVIGGMMLIGFKWQAAVVVFALTFLEHMWIDSRKPVIAWKTFLEKRISGNRGFEISQMPFFVLIEIDQTIHYLRIFLLSLMLASGAV